MIIAMVKDEDHIGGGRISRKPLVSSTQGRLVG